MTNQIQKIIQEAKTRGFVPEKKDYSNDNVEVEEVTPEVVTPEVTGTEPVAEVTETTGTGVVGHATIEEPTA